MRALQWRGPEDTARTEVARRRLREVRERAEVRAGRELDWADPGRGTGDPWWHDGFAVGCLLAGLVLLALAVVGAVTVVRWLL